MATLPELALAHTSCDIDDIDHLRTLAASWRILADLCFSDLMLLAPVSGDEGHRFVVLAQVRPTTGQTLYPRDMVGTVIDEVQRPLLTRGWRLDAIVEGDATILGGKERTRLQCIPVRSGGKLLALVARETAIVTGRRHGELERHYIETFDRFARMIMEGSFPFPREEVIFEDAPRVGDGVVVLNEDLRIRFASPNAVSSLHRMGIHAYTSGLLLSEIGFDENAVLAATGAKRPVIEEIERSNASILMRVIPLLAQEQVVGAVVLLRDVTDLRRRDRMLLSKDATIREIHHRVKNNLQTIAALLRLQGRRLSSPEAQRAIEESERRIRSIAIVHETLSRDVADVVAFDEIVRPLVKVVEESVANPDASIDFEVRGSAGEILGEVATPLAVVLNELMQNAVDHAFLRKEGTNYTGHVCVTLGRRADKIIIDVEDDGVGLPDGFELNAAKGLGLSIVHTLVTSELGGSIVMQSDHGTHVHIVVPARSKGTVDV